MKKLAVLAVMAMAMVTVSGAFANQNVKNSGIAEDSTTTCAASCSAAPTDSVVADSVR